MTDRETMQQALDALEHEAQKGNDDAYRVERDALRAAIEKQEQRKPVAWRKHYGAPGYCYFDDRWKTIPADAEPLYD